MAQHTEDDGFREIQLNGKQLVFLFMAATVVSVVIFLCGVLVGRGVRAERASAAESASTTSTASDVVPDAAPAPTTATPAEADPTKAAPPPDVNDLSYFDRLEKKNAPVEKLPKSAPGPTGSPAPPGPARTTAAAGAPATAPTAPAAAARPSTPRTPVASGPAPAQAAVGVYAVQVAALNVRSDADAIARRLVNKGYEAYVVGPPAGAPAVYRVRVGKFKTRREAEAVAAKLKKEEQFSPWITR